MRKQTQQLIPILAHVLSPPAEQLSAEMRQQVVQLVKYLHKQQPALVQDNAVLMGAVRA